MSLPKKLKWKSNDISESEVAESEVDPNEELEADDLGDLLGQNYGIRKLIAMIISQKSDLPQQKKINDSLVSQVNSLNKEVTLRASLLTSQKESKANAQKNENSIQDLRNVSDFYLKLRYFY